MWSDRELRSACASDESRQRHWRDSADDVRFAIEVLRQAPTYAALLVGSSFRVTRAGTDELSVRAGAVVVLTSVLDATGEPIDIPADLNRASPTLAHARDLSINTVALTSKGDRP